MVTSASLTDGSREEEWVERNGRDEAVHSPLHARREEGEEVEREPVVELQFSLTHIHTPGHLGHMMITR